jgi:hypothetical protein
MLHDASQLDVTLMPWVTLALLLGIGQKPTLQETDILAFARQRRLSDKETQILAVIFSGWETLPHLPRSTADALDFADMVEKKSRGSSLTEFFGPVWSFFARHLHDDIRLEIIGWLIAMDQSFGFRRVSPLPITGHDVMEAYPSLDGKSIGDILSSLRTAYRNGTWQTRGAGLALIRAFLTPQS